MSQSGSVDLKAQTKIRREVSAAMAGVIFIQQ
jgi:hypothetical protein